MIRIAGAVLLLLSAMCAGLSMSHAAKAHRDALRTSLDTVRSMRRSIDMFSVPRDVLFREYPAIHDHALYDAMAEDAPLLREFSDKLGQGYREDTLKLCDWTIAVLEERLHTAEREYPARCRLCIALPLFAALSVIVMLL